jgi:regulatory protein
MQAALRLIARRDRSAAEVRAELERRGTAKRLVRKVLLRLGDLGYINDHKFAAERVQQMLERGFGAERIRIDLERCGIDAQTIDATIPDLREERRRAQAIVGERFGGAGGLGARRRLEVIRWLAGRGFREEILEEWSESWSDD